MEKIIQNKDNFIFFKNMKDSLLPEFSLIIEASKIEEYSKYINEKIFQA